MSAKTAQAFTAEERQRYIGCSEFGAICGVDRWRTPLDVFQAKTGLSEPFEGNQHTLRGQRLEHVAAELFTEITGRKLRRRSKEYVHPEHPFIVGHIDRLIEGESAIAEIKAPSVAAYRKFQREGLPESMILQMQGYLGLSGYSKGEFLIFCADQMDIASFPVEFDAGIYKAAIRATVEFWNNHVLPGIPPAEDAARTETGIETSGSVTFRDDDKFTQAVAAYREAKQLESDAKELIEFTKRDIADALEGEFGIYEGGGSRVHYHMRDGRKSFDKAKLAKAHPEIDLSQFEKTGSPFVEFKVYQLRNTGE